MHDFHFSVRWFFASLAICLVLSAMVGLDAIFAEPFLDDAVILGILSFWLIGSVVILVEMWRVRGDANAVWRKAHGGPLVALPRRWHPWLLGETRRR